MLQRAASNAYSWWWASHIRTKQSKWLDNDLQEMDERVNHMLHLLGEEADSFSKRAEMYYKRRPEVISSVEEAYRAYRALAERYDRVSGELHKANHTIAVAFPEQVQYAMLEEEDDNFPKAITPIDSSKISKPTVEGLMKRKEESSSSVKAAQKRRISSPQLSKEKAQEKINRLQKSILVLQTEKEFVKSSYESGIAKYWDVEKQIIDMQEEVCYYQDEFNASAVIEDDEARALMTATALKSCEDAIVSLQEQRKKSIVLARMESARISSAREKLKALKGEYGQSSMESADTFDGLTGADSTVAGMQEEAYSLKHERLELKLICEKVREHFEMNSDTSVTELAEKIDELVNKVIILELTVSSQTAQINSLSLENGELEECLQNLEDEKMVLINDSNNLNGRLKQAEEDLNRVQILAETVQDEENTLRSNFTEALNNLSDIADKLQSDDHEDQVSFAEKETLTCNIGSPTEEKLVEGESRQIQEPVPISNGCVQSKMGSQTAADLENVHESSTQEDNHLEEEKPILINDSNDLDGRLKQAEELNRVQTLTETVQYEERTLGSNFTEAFNNLSDIADKLQSDDHEDQVSFSEKETLSCNIGSPSDCNGSEVAKAFDTEEKLVEEESHQIQEPVPISNGCVRSKMGSQTAAHLEKAYEFSIQEDNHRVGNSSQTPQQTLYAGSENPVDLKQAEGFEENDLPQQADFLPPSGLGNIQDPKEGEEFKEKYSSPAGDHITPCGSEYINGLKHGENCVEKESLSREHSSPISEDEKNFGDQEAMLNLQKLLLDGLEGREKILLAEYTSILRNYKETKKRLTEVEKKNQEHLHETEALIKELWKANAIKDEEIRSLRQNFSSSASSADVTSDDIEASRNGHRKIQSISFLPMLITESSEPWTSGISKYLNSASPKKADTSNELAGREKPHGEDSKLNFFDETLNTSPIEEKFRREIDTLLEEKLEYWLRFSASFNKMQEFTTKYQELQSEIEKLKDDKAQEINSRASTDLFVRPDSEPVERMLRALKTDVQVWLEQNALLRGELQSKISSLCSIQDGITEALCTSSGNEAKFNSYQAAKFQGEVLHMQQENNKLADELQAGLDHIRGLQAKIEKALSKLHDNSKVSGSKSSQYQNFKHSPTRTKIPLRSFLFGNKPKKSSLLSCITPALQKQYSDLRSAKFD